MLQMEPVHKRRLNAGSFCVKEKKTMDECCFFLVYNSKNFLADLVKARGWSTITSVTDLLSHL
jgi:hypothetical protein